MLYRMSARWVSCLLCVSRQRPSPHPPPAPIRPVLPQAWTEKVNKTYLLSLGLDSDTIKCSGFSANTPLVRTNDFCTFYRTLLKPAEQCCLPSFILRLSSIIMDKFVIRSSTAPTSKPCTSSSHQLPKLSCSLPHDNDIIGEEQKQPRLKVFPKNSNGRCFRAQWYQQFPWLEYSIEKDSAFCYPCRKYSVRTSKYSVRTSREFESVFLKIGFRSWKSALGDKSKGFPMQQRQLT